MSKNLTRKGLALGAIVALGASAFAGTPAFAADAGINDGSVRLSPNVGTEYNVLNGNSFDLKANFNRTGQGNLKFLVTDPTSEIKAASTVTVAASIADRTTETVATVTLTAHGLQTGDSVTIAGGTAANRGTFTVTRVDANTFTYPVSAATVAGGAGTTVTYTPDAVKVAGATLGSAAVLGYTLATSTGSNPVTALTDNRTTSGSFIVNTGVSTIGADSVLRLANTDLTNSNTITVTAWLDGNGDNLIDATEYQSPTRTINFYDSSAITATTTLRPAAVGDTNIVADVTTSPVLNGDQMKASYNAGSAAAIIKATFGRSGDTHAPESASTSWSDLTKKWTVTSIATDSYNADATLGWTDTKASFGGNASLTIVGYKVSITKNVATITTGSYAAAAWTAADHKLHVGDTVQVITQGSASKWETAAAVKVTSVPTTSTFTYAVDTANESTTDTASTVLGHDNETVVTAEKDTTYLVAGTYLRDKLEAGSVSAQAYLYDYTATAAFAKAGSEATYAIGSKVVGTSGVVITGVGSKDVSVAGNFRTGATAGTLAVSVTDALGDAVAAGVDVTVTAQASASAVITVNGTAVGSAAAKTIYAKTDANGQVLLAVTNTSALVGETLTVNAKVQGVDATPVVATWQDATYSIYDLNDAASTATNVAVAKGGSYTFKLLVQDQFKTALTGDYRLVASASGRASINQIVTLTAGAANLVVADSGIAGATDSLTVLVQKSTAGVWANVEGSAVDSNFLDWAAGEAGVRTVNFYDQTDAITLNATGANYPSSTAAALSATATSVALSALDLRVVNGTAPAIVAANTAVVSGKVANATTGAAKSGALVTVSGTGLVFKTGSVWSVGSATTIADDGTFAVEVYSATAGEKTVTVAVGSVTKTATVTFTGLGASSTNKLTAAAGAATTQAGRAVDYTATVVDKLGNPVAGFALKATVAGAGYFAGSNNADGSVSVSTDVYGKAVVKVLFGANDAGTATVTFADNDASTATADNLKSVVLTTEVGITDADVTVGGRAIFASVEFAKGKTVSVSVDGVRLYSKLQSTDNYTELKFTQKKAGKHTVTVRVSGGLVINETVVTTK